MEDRELVRRAQAGDQSAFGQLVERYTRKVYNLCFGMVHNPETAEDLSQEAFLKLYKNIARFNGESSFYTWLYRIVVNVCIDFLRHEKEAAGQVEYDDGIIHDELTPACHAYPTFDPWAALKNRTLGRAIQEALSKLTEPHRTVLILRGYEGLSYIEISKRMQTPKGTVMSRLFHARQNLLREMNGAYEGGGMSRSRRAGGNKIGEKDRRARAMERWVTAIRRGHVGEVISEAEIHASMPEYISQNSADPNADRGRLVQLALRKGVLEEVGTDRWLVRKTDHHADRHEQLSGGTVVGANGNGGGDGEADKATSIADSERARHEFFAILADKRACLTLARIQEVSEFFRDIQRSVIGQFLLGLVDAKKQPIVERTPNGYRLTKQVGWAFYLEWKRRQNGAGERGNLDLKERFFSSASWKEDLAAVFESLISHACQGGWISVLLLAKEIREVFMWAEEEAPVQEIIQILLSLCNGKQVVLETTTTQAGGVEIRKFRMKRDEAFKPATPSSGHAPVAVEGLPTEMPEHLCAMPSGKRTGGPFIQRYRAAVAQWAVLQFVNSRPTSVATEVALSVPGLDKNSAGSNLRELVEAGLIRRTGKNRHHAGKRMGRAGVEYAPLEEKAAPAPVTDMAESPAPPEVNAEVASGKPLCKWCGSRDVKADGKERLHGGPRFSCRVCKRTTTYRPDGTLVGKQTEYSVAKIVIADSVVTVPSAVPTAEPRPVLSAIPLSEVQMPVSTVPSAPAEPVPVQPVVSAPTVPVDDARLRALEEELVRLATRVNTLERHDDFHTRRVAAKIVAILEEEVPRDLRERVLALVREDLVTPKLTPH